MNYAGYVLNVATLGVKHWMSFIQDVRCVNQTSYMMQDLYKEEKQKMQIKVTVELEETTNDGSINSNTFKKFINIPDNSEVEDILSMIPVAMSHAAFQIVDKLKEGIE